MAGASGTTTAGGLARGRVPVMRGKVSLARLSGRLPYTWLVDDTMMRFAVFSAVGWVVVKDPCPFSCSGESPERRWTTQ